MLGLGRGDEKLRAVGVGAAVGHCDETLVGELHAQVLVFENWAVNGLSARALLILEGLPTLDAESRDHSVNPGSLVVQWLASVLAGALLPCAQALEVLDCPRHGVAIKAQNNAAHGFLIDLNIEEAFLRDLKLQFCLFLLALEQEALADGLESIVGIPKLLLGPFFQPNGKAALAILAVIEGKVRVDDINLVQDLVVDDQAALLRDKSGLKYSVPAVKDHILLLYIVGNGNVNEHCLSAL
mmetsp:Transcript_128200/g.304393  ORF Transcript_128200/g.304393 Transcript_128200/m.304393 type:complete len:240 (+) Transcript_128200:297-1016(+)